MAEPPPVAELYCFLIDSPTGKLQSDNRCVQPVVADSELSIRVSFNAILERKVGRWESENLSRRAIKSANPWDLLCLLLRPAAH